jgi:hypothetical protein
MSTIASALKPSKSLRQWVIDSATTHGSPPTQLVDRRKLTPFTPCSSTADQLEGCIEGSAEEHEFSAIVSAIVAYEKKRWPEGRRAAKVSCLAPFQFSDFPLRPPSPKTRMLIHSAHAKCMGSNPQICVFFPSNLRPRCLFTCFGAMVTMRSQLT